MTGWNIRSTVGIANTALNVMWRPTSEQSQAISDAAAKSDLSLDDFTSQFSSLNELCSGLLSFSGPRGVRL